MTPEQQRQQNAEKRWEAAAAQHQGAEDRRAAMEEGRQIAEEMRDTREQVRSEQGAAHQTSLERRMAQIEEHLRQLDARVTQLEAHLLQHVETLHRQTQDQAVKNTEHIGQAQQTAERSRQTIEDTNKLIGRVRGQIRNSHD